MNIEEGTVDRERGQRVLGQIYPLFNFEKLGLGTRCLPFEWIMQRIQRSLPSKSVKVHDRGGKPVQVFFHGEIMELQTTDQ